MENDGTSLIQNALGEEDAKENGLELRYGQSSLSLQHYASS